MSSNRSETFECTICKQHHKLYPDTLPPGYSGHKPHCIFCLLHTLYRSIIPAKPSHRLTPEQLEKHNIIRTRKIVIGTIIPIIAMAVFAFRWQIQYWPRVIKGYEQGEGLWTDRLLWFMLCMACCAPCGCVLGFLASVIYYSFWGIKKKRAKRRTARQQNGTSGDAAETLSAVPLEEKPLTELRYEDLRELNETIQIVVTPPESQGSPPRPTTENRMSKMLGVVKDKFKNGYDGRAVRRESWAAIEEAEEADPRGDDFSAAGRRPRPTTEWPAL